MKTINLTLFSFDELSENVQKEIIERERWNVMERCMGCYASEYKASLKSFEKLTDTEACDWNVGYSGYSFDFMFDDLLYYEDPYDCDKDCFAISIIILCRISQKAGIIPRANM